jgi:two-component system sensor histidine kinase KdpD
MTRGRLRVYLGAAPGVGKTYAMLAEAQRRLARGTDVVVGFVETHDRARTAELLTGLETIPRRAMTYHGAAFEEMDLDAVLARNPTVAVVDELAHTNIPGSRHAKRWQDVEDLLAAGIDVLSTVNIQHLESLNDVVAAVTGIPQRETIPDDVVRRADQVELVDMAPDALRRRLAHGNVYPPERIDAALTNYFRVGNLTALRELALLWMADKVDDQLDDYRAQHGISRRWEARERVVVALTGGAEGEVLLRRGARIAGRTAGGELLAVHVTRSDGLVLANLTVLQQQRELVESLGGSYHQVVGHRIAEAVVDFARGANASQLVLGVSRHTWLGTLTGGRGTAAEIARRAGDIDVHLVNHPAAGKGRQLPEFGGHLTPRRRLAGTLVAMVGLPALTAVLASLRGTFGLASDLLLFQMLILAVALVGGIYPAVVCAVSAGLLADWFFAPPLHSLFVRDHENVLALVAFVLFALVVSSVVEAAARHIREAARARAEAATLIALSGNLLAGQDAVAAVLERVRETFAVTSATLLERNDAAVASTRDTWALVGASGSQPCLHPERADTTVPIRPGLVLTLTGRTLPAADRSVLAAFAAQAAVALEHRRLSDQAAESATAAAADRARAALLTAVSHDLRTPLTAAKAAVSSLRSPDVTWSAQDSAELLATADESLDRLVRLVENLLDVSRLQSGALRVTRQAAALDDLVPLALDLLGPPGRTVRVEVPPSLPEVIVDPDLLERVIAHLAANALRHAPDGQPPVITAQAHDDRVELQVTDTGPGVPAADRDRIFTPFQRLGDHDNTTGLGLGLALSRGIVEAMGGTLLPRDTPGGGLTMVVTVPAAPEPAGQPADAPGADGALQ